MKSVKDIFQEIQYFGKVFASESLGVIPWLLTELKDLTVELSNRIYNIVIELVSIVIEDPIYIMILVWIGIIFLMCSLS